MADIPRSPVFQRLPGWLGSVQDAQGGVTGVLPGLIPVPPSPLPPGQVLLAPSPAPVKSSIPWLAPFLNAFAPLTDLPRTPNFQPYRDYDRKVGVNAQDWVWQNNLPALLSIRIRPVLFVVV